MSRETYPITVHSASSHRSNVSANDSDEIDENQATTVNQTIDHITEPPSLQSILDEVGDLTSGANYSTNSIMLGADDDTIDTGPEEIIRDMDRDDTVADTTDGLRQRRRPDDNTTIMTQSLAVDDGPTVATTSAAYTAQASSSTTTAVPTTSSASIGTAMAAAKPTLIHQDSADKSANTDNCTNENCENGNVIEAMPVVVPDVRHRVTVSATTPINRNSGDDEFRIKLKYLNDDLKLVKGTPNEAIGDFKKSVKYYETHIIERLCNGEFNFCAFQTKL